MTYGDSGQGFRDEPRFRGEGFREEPDFRSDTGLSTSYSTGSYPVEDYGSSTADMPSRRSVSAAELDDVFDDPHQGEPGMDRMTVHVIWEVLLLVGTAAVYVLFRQTHSAGVSGNALRGLLLDGAALGFITIGVALSLRAAVVNLAAGPIAAASALFFAQHSDRNLPATVGVTVLLAAGAGAVIGILVVAFHVPAWAASLAGGFGVIVWIQKHGPATNLATYHPARQAMYWFGAFAALSLLGGVLGLIKPLRRSVGRWRPTGDPASRRGAGAALMAFVALLFSSALAGLGGILTALATKGAVAPVDGIALTGLALGVALAGGTSAYGRRGGIFGTIFAVTLVTLLIHFGDAANWKVAPYAWAAGAVGAGLIVTRLVETVGRPRSPGDEDNEAWAAPRTAASPASNPSSGTNGWSDQPRQGGWSSQLPARSLDDTWGGAGDDRWGSR